jgi:hypothetical protein
VLEEIRTVMNEHRGVLGVAAVLNDDEECTGFRFDDGPRVMPVGPGDYETPHLYYVPVFERANQLLAGAGAQARWHCHRTSWILIDANRKATLERLGFLDQKK